MKARMAPVDDALDQSMFQRIQMHVVHVVPVVPLILNQVFPVAPLPDSSLAARAVGGRQYFGFRQAPGEGEFDDLPAQREISLAIR